MSDLKDLTTDKLTFDHTLTPGTLDEMEPALRARGFVAIRMMSGPIDLADADPYGMRRVGSVNIQSEKWAHHIYRGRLARSGDTWYLADEQEPTPGFVGGLFELLTAEGAEVAR